MSKFLSYEDRMVIAQRLQENASFGAIGKELGKDRTTIAKEIKKYSAKYVASVDEFLEENLLYDARGNERTISQRTMEQYMLALRQEEESIMCGKN